MRSNCLQVLVAPVVRSLLAWQEVEVEVSVPKAHALVVSAPIEVIHTLPTLCAHAGAAPVVCQHHWCPRHLPLARGQQGRPSEPVGAGPCCP